jgi:tRNA pseudouridine38-40 synthase
VVRSAERAPEGFDARRSAVARRYRYLVWNAPVPDPLLAPVAWHVADPLDLRAMANATDAVIGEHDFRGFCRRPPGTGADEPLVRRVTRAGWSCERGPEPSEQPERSEQPEPSEQAEPSEQPEPWDVTEERLLRLDIEATSFCHQMVRSLVGTLVGVGRGRGNAATVVAQLRAADRQGAPQPAPAHGLCLVAVRYDDQGGRP